MRSPIVRNNLGNYAGFRRSRNIPVRGSLELIDDLQHEVRAGSVEKLLVGLDDGQVDLGVPDRASCVLAERIGTSGFTDSGVSLGSVISHQKQKTKRE